MLADLFPAAYDVLALQQVFPTVSMHAHANWICQNIPVREYSGIHQLRGILKEAMHVYIYTDGSVPATDREDQAPAFALVIFFENAHGDLFTLGHLGAQLRHSGSLFQLGFVDSTLTEFAGIIYARLWIAAVAPLCPVHIFSDSLTAIEIINKFHNPGIYRPLANFAHAIGMYISHSIQHHAQHALSHVKGHNDQPWNELADSLAKSVGNGDYRPPPVATSLVSLIKDSLFVPWMHLTQASHEPHIHAPYPPMVGHEFIATSIHTHSSPLHNYCAVSEVSKPPSSAQHLVFRTATHNVMSGKDKRLIDTLAFDSANVSYLSQQYAHHFLHVVGQQESRLPPKKKIGALYIIISSGHTKHCLGCSIWISRFLPYLQLNGKLFCVTIKHVHVICSTPRLLVLDIDAPYLRIRIISAHAPTAKDAATRDSFFQDLGKYVLHPHRVMLFIDANSRPTSDVSSLPGGQSNSQIKHAAHQFQQFLELHSLQSTHQVPIFQKAVSGTWTSPHSTHSMHTIDYVVTKEHDISCVKHASTLPSIDNGHMLQDHLPSAASFVFQAGPDHSRPRCDRIRITKQQILDPANRESFSLALQQIPSQAWDIPLDAHYNTTAASVFQAIKDAFPRPKLVARRPHISLDTLHLSAEFRSFKQQVRYLRTCLGSFSFSLTHVQQIESAIQHISHLLRLLNKQLKMRSAADMANYIHNISKELNASLFCNQPDVAWKILKKLIGTIAGNKYSNDRAPPMLVDDLQVPVSSEHQKLQLFFNHFAKLELAESMTDAQLTSRCSQIGPTKVDYVPSLANIMSPFDFASRITRQSRGYKAPGFDCSMPELAAIDPKQYVRLFHPIHVKMAITSTEPLQLKGSINAPVPKKGPNQHVCTAFRAITLRNHLLKVHHGYLRSQVYPLLHASLHLAQTGGVKGRGTDVSNALLRWNLFHQKASGNSSVTFFCDVTAAFYTMIRQLVVPVSYQVDDLNDIIDKIGVPDCFIEPLQQLISDTSTLERLVQDKHLLAMLSESQRIPWFQVQGNASIACTKTGSGPGGPLADLMYNLAMLPVIQHIDKQMTEQGLLFSFPNTTQVFSTVGRQAQSREPVSDSTLTAFVDDLSGSAPLKISQCHDLASFQEAIASFVSIFISCLHSRGMVLNCKPGKSAILVSLAGVGSKKAATWLHTLGGYISIQGCMLQVVKMYTLLGGVIDDMASLGPELHNRQKAVTMISAPYHKYVATKASFSLAQSVNCVNSFIVSSLLFNSHTWCDMSESQLHHLDSRLATAYGACVPFRIMNHGNGKHRRLSDKHVLALTNMPDAYRQLRYRRLLFLPRLLRSATDSLLSVLDASVLHAGSFAHTITDDLQWLGSASHHIVSMESPPVTLFQWLNFCNTPSWRGILRSAYHNDNRLFHDDIAHNNMLHDIYKLHLKTSTPCPNFTTLFLPPSMLQADSHHPATGETTLSQHARPGGSACSLSPDSQVGVVPCDDRSDTHDNIISSVGFAPSSHQATQSHVLLTGVLCSTPNVRPDTHASTTGPQLGTTLSDTGHGSIGVRPGMHVSPDSGPQTADSATGSGISDRARPSVHVDMCTGYQQSTEDTPSVRPVTQPLVRPDASPNSSVACLNALSSSVQPIASSLVPAAQHADLQPHTFFICYECGYTSKTKTAWHNHMRTHAFQPLVKTLVDGHTCKICLRCFPSIARLTHHLEVVSRRCLAAWDSLDVHISIQTQQEIEQIRMCEAQQLVGMGYRETKSLHPVIVCPGPLRQLTAQPLELLQLEVPSITLDYDPSIPPPPAPYGTMAPTLSADGKATPTDLLDPDSFTSASFFPLGSFIKLNVRLVLHLFSGQRREHDFQAEFERFLQCSNFKSNVCVLSLDIVLHPQLGDLTNPQAISLWQDLIALGIVIFVLAGPPCETWSAARYLALPDDGPQGPRPLRSQTQLWGLPILKRAEAQSVSVGNALLRATIRMFYAALTSPATAVIMEHPMRPSWMPTAPSSWLVPELRYLARQPNCVSVDIDQCMFGAASKKPTTLLCLQVQHLHLLRDLPHRCDKSHVHATVLRGLDSNGLFRTAPAKTYPKGLCSILAKLACAQYDSICDRSPPQPPDLDQFFSSDLARFYIPTDPYLNSAQSFGADFSSLSGLHTYLPPLPNGKAARVESELLSARQLACTAIEGLSRLPNGMTAVDKHGCPRVSFHP